ncbi:uncharacterized protein LOC129915361 [Episyrphus balteatus]|uniref:uncharacterized protein LOC129915361 n=1 Tax=Episyrphus balteatus TaxID=286459 RepID=UPI002485164D|nr:uncharacterized protein LOC129915361 [Episyrphus balteatus]
MTKIVSIKSGIKDWMEFEKKSLEGLNTNNHNDRPAKKLEYPDSEYNILPTFGCSSRSRPTLIIGKYTYLSRTEKKNTYRCARNRRTGCKATAHTKLIGGVLMCRLNNSHSHD